MDMNMEFRIKKIQELFRTLEMYQREVDPPQPFVSETEIINAKNL